MSEKTNYTRESRNTWTENRETGKMEQTEHKVRNNRSEYKP